MPEPVAAPDRRTVPVTLDLPGHVEATERVELRARVPRRYPLRNYPDITHSSHAQHVVPVTHPQRGR